MTEGKAKYVGVDACKGGWFSVGLNDDNDYYEIKGFWEFSDLLDYYKDACLILVDIPIGLPKDGGWRECDLAARCKLGSGRSSIFQVPGRRLLRKIEDAYDSRMSYREQYKRARQFADDLSGPGLSSQTFGIIPKIVQVDKAVRKWSKSNTDSAPSIREIHPEICFYTFEGEKVTLKKDTTAGVQKRLDILKRIYPASEMIYEWVRDRFPPLRNLYNDGDILDALAAAVTAKLGCADPNYELRRLPSECPTDCCKPMPPEMVYAIKKADKAP